MINYNHFYTSNAVQRNKIPKKPTQKTFTPKLPLRVLRIPNSSLTHTHTLLQNRHHDGLTMQYTNPSTQPVSTTCKLSYCYQPTHTGGTLLRKTRFTRARRRPRLVYAALCARATKIHDGCNNTVYAGKQCSECHTYTQTKTGTDTCVKVFFHANTNHNCAKQMHNTHAVVCSAVQALSKEKRRNQHICATSERQRKDV